MSMLCSHFGSSKLNTRSLEQHTEENMQDQLPFLQVRQSTYKVSLIISATTVTTEAERSNCSITLLLLKLAALSLQGWRTQDRWCCQPGLHPAPGVLLAIDTNLLLCSSRQKDWKWFLPQLKWKSASSRLQYNEDKKHHSQNSHLITFLKFLKG